MRIISGKLKGRVIHPPKNLRARPTTDFAKENLFNVLANMVDFDELDVLDLFSGTGSIGYEFWSRGAGSVMSVEVSPLHYRFIRNTVKELGMENFYPVHANAFLYVKNCKKKFDLIFADAPYDIPGTDTLPDLIFDHQLLRENGLFVMEHSKNADFSGHEKFCETRSYGSVRFSFFKNE